MIIYANGWDINTRETSMSSCPMIINTEDILYAKGCGTATVVYLRHNTTKKIHDETRTGPIWVKLNMPTKEFYKKWKEAEKG